MSGAGWLDDPDDGRLDAQELDGWHVGLMTASYLRFYFPDFWAEHVADKPVTTARLLGVVHAFIELGDDALLTIDTDHYCPLDLGTSLADVPDLIDGYVDHGGILGTLCNELWGWILRPPVACYGIDADELGQAWREGRDRLCLLLWWMLRQTSWQVAGLSPTEVRALPGGELVARLPNLPAATPMGRLADALTWSCELPGVEGPWQLGDVLRLVCSQTRNEFADYSTAEALQDMAWWCEGIYAEPERLRYEQLKQRGAKRLRAIYDALDRRVCAEPKLVAQIARAIVAAGIAAVRAEEERSDTSLVALVGQDAPEEEPCAA